MTFPEDIKIKPALLAFILISLSTNHAMAQGSPPLTLTGSATLASDYRFRGLSLSNNDTALQGSFSLSHVSGFYISTWASSIESFNGAELELDLYGGHAGQIGNLNTNIGFYAYTYPGATDNTDYYEIYGSLGGTIKNTGWTLGTNYAFDQDGTGNQGNIYIYLSTSTPVSKTPITITGNIAYEDGAFGSNKWDWLLGLSYSFSKFSLSINYIDTANTGSSSGRAGVVGMLSASF